VTVNLNEGENVTCTFINTLQVSTPTIVTTLKNAADNSTINNSSSVPLGTSVYDTATLGNDGGFAFTGTVTFNYFTNGTCNGTPTATESKAVGASSSTRGPLGSGDYSFNAQYLAGSDIHHTDSLVSDCEPFHVNKATPSISTVVKDSNNATVDNDTHKAALGVTVHDTATLADGVTGFSFDGTATVTYKLFSNLSCTPGTNDANLLDSGNKTVAANGSVPDSNAFGPLGSGDYS